MNIKNLHSSWKSTAEQILAEDIKDLSQAEKDILLPSFLSGAQTFMNQSIAVIEDLHQKAIGYNKGHPPNTLDAAFRMIKQQIENCEIHLKK